MTASFFISLLSTVWISDRFCRRSEGKEEALVVVVIVVEAVSACVRIGSGDKSRGQTFVLCATTVALQNRIFYSFRRFK
jgi:hypothetical protein